MKNYSCLAHIAPDGRLQTAAEHLRQTAELTEAFASEFDAGEIGYFTGLLHDIGKYSSEFQRRINGAAIHVDHSTAGALECCKQNHLPSAIAVMGHHGGLPDGGTRTDTDSTFFARINKARKGLLPDYSAWTDEINPTNPPQYRFTDGAGAVFFTRMLYSCLTDADFLDTESFMDGIARDSSTVKAADLFERLNDYISEWFPPKNELNSKRCEILKTCINAGESNAPGLFTLTVPTGGGKTVASLAFALSQAKKHGLRRVICVVPYTSIIEQTADVFRKILGAENVLEHHSGVVYDTTDELDCENIKLAKATENWDMPVIVTTAVQFFESLFANNSSKCRKLHNLANSVIIFDEAQMLPLPYLRPCVYAISQLVKNFGVSAVLCTATQPALESVFKRYLPGTHSIELCSHELTDSKIFRRVTFQKEGTLQWDELADRINSVNQALCIVNSRKNAAILYSKLKGEGCYHLSTLMCPFHRRAQLEEIRELLKSGEPCRVVSTSLIEAGVDVDFPLVWREEAGLDSILQAAGRCNREGRRAVAESVVTIFQSENPAPQMFRAAISAGRFALSRCEDPSSAEAIHAYFTELLELKGDDALDSHGIMKLIADSLFPFREVSDRFHLIENDTRTVYIPFGNEASELIAELRSGSRNRKLYRKLGQYSVNVYPQHFYALDLAGALELCEDGSAILIRPELYDNSTGLTLEPESGQALFI